MEEKNYTNKVQALNLVDLGLDKDTADMWYDYDLISERWDVHLGNPPSGHITCIVPCWSLGALIKLLPDTILYQKVECFLEFNKDYVEYSGSTFDGEWTEQPWYISTDDESKFDMFRLIYETVCWLIKEKYIENNKPEIDITI